MALPDNWDEIKRRHEAWWRGELEGSCLLRAYAPLERVQPADALDGGVDLEKYWTDVDYVLERNERRIAATYYAGDAFPAFNPFLGPVIHTAFLGCELVLADRETGWQGPMIASWDEAPELAYDPGNRWWKLMRDITRAAAEAGRGRFVVGITDMGGPGDDLAHLRGTENALVDFIERPEKVDETLEAMFPLWCRYYDELFAELSRAGQEGSTQTFGLFAPGRSYTMQSDFSCMVSSEMFDRHIAPVLARQAAHLDYPVYHVDGPGAVRHVPTITSIADIRAVNWIPGDGNGPMRRWIGLVKQIQGAGKPVQIDARPGEVEDILRECSPRGLDMRVWCSSREEADDLVAGAGRWNARYDKPFGDRRG